MQRDCDGKLRFNHDKERLEMQVYVYEHECMSAEDCVHVASFPGLPHLQLFAYWKRSKAGGVEGLGTRLHV